MMKYGFSRMVHSNYTYRSEPNSAQKHSLMLAILCCPFGAFPGRLPACASSCLPMGFMDTVWDLDHFTDPPQGQLAHSCLSLSVGQSIGQLQAPPWTWHRECVQRGAVKFVKGLEHKTNEE